MNASLSRTGLRTFTRLLLAPAAALAGSGRNLAVRLFLADRPDLYVEVSEPRGPLRKMRGLIGSRSPGPRRGMLLRTRQVHTFGMSFPIDAVYVSAEGLVLKVRTLPPARMGPLVWGARWVLEMEAGEAQRVGISEGTYLLQEKPL